MVQRQINILTNGFIYRSYKQDQSSTERVVEGDFFHQINIARFKVNCGSFSKQPSIYEHNIPELSFVFKKPSAMSGSLCGCAYVFAHINMSAVKSGFTTLICAFVHVCY